MKTQRAFTLAEMAVVVFIMGIAMSMGLKMTNANLDNSAYSTTKAKQDRIKLALIGYLRSNGVLPCPDTSTGIATGVAASTCSTPAAQGYGVVPWVSLGLSRDAAQDGWGNLFSYRVANDGALSQITFTPP
ncbi:MAG: type II secretion system protein, partial [Nitrosomonadales bacterium]